MAIFYNRIIFARGESWQARERGESYDRRKRRDATFQEELLRYVPLSGVTVRVTSQSYSSAFGRHLSQWRLQARPLAAGVWRRTTCEVITREDVKRIRQARKDFRAKSSRLDDAARHALTESLSHVRIKVSHSKYPSILQIINKSPWRWQTSLNVESIR